MRRPRLSKATWVVIVVMTTMAAVYVGALFVAKAYYEPASPEASTHNGGQAGAKALYLYLARLGYNVDRLEEPGRVPSGTKTLVLITPIVRPPTRSETAVVRRWVARGGRLVLAGSVLTPIHQAFGIGFSHVGSRGAIVRPSQPGALVRDISAVKVSDRGRLVETSTSVAYLQDNDGPALVARRWGKGEVIALSDAFPVTNRGIETADNYALAANLAGPAGGTVLFDEFHHGYSVAPGPLGILSPSSRYAVIALAVACLLFLYGWGKRLGPAVTCEQVSQRSVTEYASSLGELFQTAGARVEAAKMLAAGLQRRIGRSPVARHDEFDATRAVLAKLEEESKAGELTAEQFSELGRQAYEARMGVERVGRGRRRKDAV